METTRAARARTPTRERGSAAAPALELVAPGVHRMRTLIANVFFVRDNSRWVLVDAGLAGYAAAVRRAAAELFGDQPPAAIVLTHGHFNHRGSLGPLLRHWHVPVYAHIHEFPYLTGRRAYPPPDPSVAGGLIARLSFLYPRRPIDIGPQLLAVPPDGRVPEIERWRWYHAPGHSPGHIALFRADDGVLIAGDAIVTTRQESLAAVVAQRAEVRPPPAYFTLDWELAETSVQSLASLQPEVLASGHGPTLRGAAMRAQLDHLVRHFRDMIPRKGWYVGHPSHPERETEDAASTRPLEQQNRRQSLALFAAGTAVVAGGLAMRRFRKGPRENGPRQTTASP